MSHFVINHPNTSMQPSYNKPLTPGYMNGIQRQTIHKLININSNIREEQAPGWPNCPKKKEKDCKKSKPCEMCDKCCYLRKWKSSNFIVRLPEPLDKVVSMKLSAAEIPNTSYVISHTIQTNVFQVIGKWDPKKSHVVEIPSGNYKNGDLVIVINNILNGFTNCNLNVAHDRISGRFYFYCTPDVDPSHELDFRLPNDNRDIKMNLGWMLGFRKAKYCLSNYNEKDKVWSNPGEGAVWPCRKHSDDNSTMAIVAKEVSDWPHPQYWAHGYVSEGIFDITGSKYLFLVVNDFNNNVHNKYTSLAMSGISFPVSNILARLTMSYSKNEIGFDDASDLVPKIREYFGPVKIEKLHIQLVDEMGRIVDLNNNDISLLLDFECLYNL